MTLCVISFLVMVLLSMARLAVYSVTDCIKWKIFYMGKISSYDSNAVYDCFVVMSWLY